VGLIKAEKAPLSAVPFSMRDIEEAARMILLRAQQQAQGLLAEAQREADLLKQQASVEGFAQGRAEGLARGTEDGHAAGKQAALDEHRISLSQLVQSLTGALTEIDASRRQLEANARADVIRLAIAIAERVTKRKGVMDPSVMTENMSAAMKMVVAGADLRIAVNPTHMQTLTDALPRLKLQWPQLQHAAIVEDASLSPGGCRIFTRQGIVDADLDEQLNRIAAELLPSHTS
jgi:flagellar assembly protein FliH